MKFIILQYAGVHDGSTHLKKNNHMRECFGIQYAIYKNNHKCDIWGPRHKDKKTPYGNVYSINSIPKLESYDYIVILENYENLWVDLDQIINPIKIQWIIDLHFNNWHYFKNISEKCDIILHSTKLLIDSYRNLLPNKTHIWFPNAVDSRFFIYKEKKKIFDFIFVGNFVNQYRKKYIENLKKEVGMKYFMKTGSEMINLISSTKIHFNLSCSIDVNYRNFETISLGTCLITNHLAELEDLGFKDGVNCIMYRNLNECKQKLKYYLMDNQWEKIAKEGLELSKKHTYIVRIKNLLPKLLKFKKNNIIK